MLTYIIAPVLPPFLIAIVLAYLSNPIVTRLESKGIPRTLTIVIFTLTVLVLFVIFIVLLWPIIKDQAFRFSRLLPEYIERFREFSNWINEQLHFVDADSASPDVQEAKPDATLQSAEGNQATETTTENTDTEITANTTDTQVNSATNASESESNTITESNLVDMAKDSPPDSGVAVSTAVTAIKQSLSYLVSFFSTLFLIPVIGFYLVRDWNQLIEKLRLSIPARYRQSTISISKNIDNVVGQFIRGQLLVMLALAIIYGVGLSIIGAEFALLIALVSGTLSFVPFLGTFIGVVMALLSALSQSPTWLGAGLVLMVFTVGQFIEGNFLSPKLVGDKVDLHPVVVIFALATGAQLFGFTGLLLALPGAAILWAVIKFFRHERINR